MIIPSVFPKWMENLCIRHRSPSTGLRLVRPFNHFPPIPSDSTEICQSFNTKLIKINKFKLFKQMKLLIINVLFLLIALKAFSVPGGHYSESATWSECKLEKNGFFKLEKGCKTLQICYKSKLASGTLKFGGRFRLGKRVNERPLSDCAGVVARNEWHALNVSKISDRIFTIQSSLGFNGQFSSVIHIKPNDFFEAINISKDFGPIETDFLKALHLGAFMKDFDGMAFRILALDLLSSIGQNGTGLCKKTCAFEPTAWHKDHFGTNCMEIVFPADVPKFMLNISATPYELGCSEYEKIYQPYETLPDEYYSDPYYRYADACKQVPTSKCQKQAKAYVCYKTKNRPGNSSIAELCRKHLGGNSNSNVAGFSVQICVHRDAKENMVVVESFFNLSFSDETFKTKWNFSITTVGAWVAKHSRPIFFIEFGNGQRQSAVREKTGGEPINGSKWNNENVGIGSVLNDIEQEKINGTWAKKLHFVSPSTSQMRVFFQIPNPEFSRLITQDERLKSSKNNPNTRNTYSPCDVYGDDCDEIRELLKAIEDLESCHGNRPLFPDDDPWNNQPFYSLPFEKRSENLICNFDAPCNKTELHEEYIEAQKRCGLAPEEGNR